VPQLDCGNRAWSRSPLNGPAWRTEIDDVIEGDILAQTVLRHRDETIAPGMDQRMTSTEGWLHSSQPSRSEEVRPLHKRDGRPRAKSSPTGSSASNPHTFRPGVLIGLRPTPARPLPRMTRPPHPAPTRADSRMLLRP